MKIPFVILAIMTTLVPPSFRGCGEGDEGSSANRQAAPRVIPAEGRFAAITLYPSGAQPKMKASDLPPPRGLLTRELRTGSGRRARSGDRLKIYYYSVNYRTGRRAYFRWPPQHPLVIRLGSKPWESALHGMKVGGLREEIVPSRLLAGAETVDYIFEVRRIR